MVKTAVSAQTHDVSRRLPGPDRVVKAITMGLLRTTPDAIDEHRNGGIPGHLQGFFFVIRATDLHPSRSRRQVSQANRRTRNGRLPRQSSIGADPGAPAWRMSVVEQAPDHGRLPGAYDLRLAQW